MAAHGASPSLMSDASHSSVSPQELPPTPPPTSNAVSESPRESKASSANPLLLQVTSPEDPLPIAAFYGPLDAKNPLLATFEKEIRELLGFIKKKKALETTTEEKHELRRRCATSLFDIWTKYAPRLPDDYYNEKLLKVGDSLCQMKEYKLALWQCYGRYLQQFSTNFDENEADVKQFKAVFFPKGFGDKTAALTFHALSAKNICNYRLICDADLNMKNKESVNQCLSILFSLRLIMQVALPQEHLCWIIFNGTIYIYTICRKLMILGQSSKALEYLLWASMCMESSVPLLSVRYLTWRTTLYTAVCQCYYDCQVGVHGEAFARRGLAKIDELRQLELMSSSQSQEESRRYFREATIKLPWPRTITERLLDEMFDSSASRFLAVLEALSDPTRRTLQTGPIVTDEVELRDVVSELFIAGKELLMMSSIGPSGMLGFPNTSLLELLMERANVISLEAAVKFIKLAFTYEEWSLFESSAMQLIYFLQRQDDPESKKAEKDLTLLIAIEPLINLKRNKGLIIPLENYKEGESTRIYLKQIASHDFYVRNYGFSEDIFHLAAILYICVCNSPQDVKPDKEIVVDMIMFLWQKCKFGIQRISTSRYDYAKFTQKISSNKWFYLLWQINEVIHHYKLEDIDIVVVAEVTLRLSEILESLANPRRKFKKYPDASLKTEIKIFPGTPKGILDVLPILKKSPVEQLFFAYELLDKVIGAMNSNCVLSTLPSGSPVIDHCYVKVSWYCILGCKAEGSYGKVRLNNNHLPNSGEAIPADGKSIFEVKGLEMNEKYIFAVAAYSSNGKLVGDAIGETTKPILVYPPLSTVTTRMYLTQVAYQIGNYELTKKVFSPVWDYFVASPLQDEQSTICLSNIMTITQRRLYSDILAETSSILLFLFLRNIFVISDIKIKEENLFCDNIKGNDIFPAQQMARLMECERVLVALELSIFLNDSSYILQAVTQCYGLLAPIIYHNIVLVPVVQGSSKKSLKTKKPQQVFLPEKLNEQLNLLESHLLRMIKQYVVTELSGAEDPIFLYPVVLNWSVKGAVKEVMKFKHGPRFLEFFTQVMLKCMNEEKFSLLVEITIPVYDFLKRRNESLIGQRKIRYRDNVAYKKANMSSKKFKAVVVEIGKNVDTSSRKKNVKRETLRDFYAKNPFIFEIPENERHKRPDVRKVAHRYLMNRVNPLILDYVKRKRFHQIFLEEMPWRAQMNLYLAITHYNLLLQKLGERMKMKFGVSHTVVSFRSCDPNIFSLYNSGTVLPTAKLTVENYIVMLDFLLTAKKRKAYLPSDAEEFSAFVNSKSSEDNIPKTRTFYESDFQSGLSAREKDRAHLELDHFMKVFLYCRRAMVLAHRGGYWTLLQNCCRTFWNFTQELQILLKQTMDLYKTFPVSQDTFLCTSVLPFYLGAELLIDMLLHLQNIDSIKFIEDKGEFIVPSCYGNIKYDNGGSSLSFEHPLDDVNVVDLKWIHDFVLKSLEVLYQVEKWETLVSLAIHFNIISHERYTEQVTPLLVYAQRQLLLRIQRFKGPDITQQSCARYEAEYGEKITCRNFIGKQLKIDPSISKTIDTGDCTDFLKVLISSEYSRAKQIICVPVDVTDTLRCFRETLEKSKYHNRSIRHSRKLLSLFLAQTQGLLLSAGVKLLMTYSENQMCYIHGKNLAPPLPVPPTVIHLQPSKTTGLLRTTLPHPKAQRSYAQYEITQLLPGIELFSDRNRADICSVIASLYYVIRELHYAKQNLMVEVLTDLHFFSEAFYELSQIFYGKNMPCSVPSGFKATGKIKMFPSFDSGKPLTNKENVQALDELINRGLPVVLVTIGQPHLLNKFYLVKAYFFTSVAATINCVPENSLKILYQGASLGGSERSKPTVPNLKELYLKDDGGGSLHQLTKVKDEFTLNMLKSVLLMEAEERLNFLVSEMEHPGHKDLSQCSAGELEIVVEARLQLAAVALQRHRAAHSALVVTVPAMCKADCPVLLFAEHTPLSVHENDMTDCLNLIREVCVEAKSAEDLELQAEFLMQAVILGLQEKHLKADIITNLQDIIHLLEGKEFISPRSWLTLARSLVLLDDLTKAEKFKESPSSKTEKLKFLTQAHNILIEQMLTFGETIELYLSNPEYANLLQPLKNIYLPHVMLLAKVKMRIGHTLAKQVYYSNKKKDSSKWLPALHLFDIALGLCRITAMEEHEVEAEILFQKGKIERQILMEEKSPTMQLESLFEAVQLSLKNDQNSGLIRDSYLELALWYLHLKKPKRKNSATPLTLKVSEAVLAINLLIGKKNARTDKVSEIILPNIPEFATVDLLSSYTDYLLDNYQVDFQNFCTALYQNDDIYDNTDARTKIQTKVDITWILLLRYYIHLQRINNLSKLLASAKPVSGISLPDDTLLTSVYNSELILRQKEMHIFLKKYLQLYSSSCIDEFPKELFLGLENPLLSEKVLYDTSAKVYHDSSQQSVFSLKLYSSPSPTDITSSEMAIQTLNKELCFQWYIPPLDKPPKDGEPMVLLLCAYNTKLMKSSDIRLSNCSNIFVDSFWIPLNRVISVHEKLSNLAQIAELSLPAIPEITSNEDAYKMEETEEKPIDKDMEVPFDISLPSIFNLERLFDLANGCIISGGSLFNWIVSIIS
ncbi:Cilia- and flagella-associated protein 54 [Sciurus carolinensis]|uniref:Cilia- and flagella-associated protein 54 n=1 Tax=Sciurus carolinensis TaxID=30640 RepID=A0AA41T475_SCICA|nr:Cilia- and flagella-associated protein 54 [Sciurus carolinensis]